MQVTQLNAAPSVKDVNESLAKAGVDDLVEKVTRTSLSTRVRVKHGAAGIEYNVQTVLQALHSVGVWQARAASHDERDVLIPPTRR